MSAIAATFDVVDLETDETIGPFHSYIDARRCARKLDAYAIWRDLPDRYERVERCEPYRGDDERIRESLGLPPLYRDDTPSLDDHPMAIFYRGERC